jgi:hypothetical protein
MAVETQVQIEGVREVERQQATTTTTVETPTTEEATTPIEYYYVQQPTPPPPTYSYSCGGRLFTKKVKNYGKIYNLSFKKFLLFKNKN